MSDSPLLLRRSRRVRQHAGLRRLVRASQVTPDDLIMPLFVKEEGPREPIPSLPGQFRLPLVDLPREAEHLALLGIPAVALFPVIDPRLKTPGGEAALETEALVLRAMWALKAAVPEMVVVTDIALDPYTAHGHDGILTADGRDVDNDATVSVLAQMATLHAEAGVDVVAPSDMMDGRVGAIRLALESAGHTRTALMSYAAKFNSAFYGPFREAVGSASAAGTPGLDKATYQADPANRDAAVADALLDEEEGADILMVKPAGPYLDVLHSLRSATRLPLAAYQVSGEYAQLHAAAERGWLDLRRARDESLLAIKRAGADGILTYFARAFAEDFRSSGDSGVPHYSHGAGI